MPGQHDDGYAPGGPATPPPGATPVPPPGVTPAYPTSTPPYPVSTPPYVTSTPPYPVSTPPYPASTPPYPTPTLPYPMSGPPGGGGPYQGPAGPQLTGGFPATAVMPRAKPPSWLVITLVAAIVVAVAGVGTLAWSRFWGGGGVNDRDVAFIPFQQIGSLPGPGSNYGRVFTTVTGDRAYVAHTREDDKLEIRAVQASTARELWRAETSIAAPNWEQVASVSVGVAALSDGYSSSTPEQLVVFNTDGREIWTYPVRSEDQIFFLGDAVVVVDRFANQLVGLRAADGVQTWRHDNPATSSGRKTTAVYPVNSYERLTGPGDFSAIPFAPRSDDHRVVQVGADRSVRIIDAATGAVAASRPNVADPTDKVAVLDGTLYVAAEDSRSGYRAVAHDLATLGEPKVLHTAVDPAARVEELIACGPERVCLLETVRYDVKTATVLVLGGEKPVHWAVPGAKQLSAAGEHVFVNHTGSPYTTKVYALDGRTVLDAQGSAVRLNGRSMLLFANSPSASLGDESVAGVNLADGVQTPLGLLRGVRLSSCSWNTELIVCAGDKSFVFHRFAAAD